MFSIIRKDILHREGKRGRWGGEVVLNQDRRVSGHNIEFLGMQFSYEVKWARVYVFERISV